MERLFVTTKVVTDRHPKTTKNTKTQRHKGKFIHFFFVFLVPLCPLWFVNRGTLAGTIILCARFLHPICPRPDAQRDGRSGRMGGRRQWLEVLQKMEELNQRRGRGRGQNQRWMETGIPLPPGSPPSWDVPTPRKVPCSDRQCWPEPAPDEIRSGNECETRRPAKMSARPSAAMPAIEDWRAAKPAAIAARHRPIRP